MTDGGPRDGTSGVCYCSLARCSHDNDRDPGRAEAAAQSRRSALRILAVSDTRPISAHGRADAHQARQGRFEGEGHLAQPGRV